jgi:hypothetical protein
VLLGCSLLGDVGEHGGALGRFEVLGASLLKQRLRLRPACTLAWLSSTRPIFDLLLHRMLGLEGSQLLRGGRHDLVRRRDIFLSSGRVLVSCTVET